MSPWGNGGFLLGFLAAMLGRQGIWICTAAVESTVHRQLQDQLRFLTNRDRQLHTLILSIQDQELGHLHHAEVRISWRVSYSRTLHTAISRITDAVIWLSTWGDSTRMARDLASAA